ncbi:hypothetical protein D3C87_618580 [compost metagenome]
MKPSLILLFALAGCAGQTTIGPEGPERLLPDSLQLEARGIERACGVAEASLLHPNSDGNLEVWAVAGADISYPRFACVWSAIQNAKLSERGIEIVLIGEDAP